MRLYSGKIPAITREIVRVLTENEDIEVENADEVVEDLASVLKEYVRREREIADEAKNRLERQGGSYGLLAKIRREVAKEHSFPPPDEFLPYVLDQLLEMLFHSANVAEVFADDVELRKAITPILKKHLEVDVELDREVRARIKNLDEGTAQYEIEYQRVLDQIKRKKQLG